MIGIDEVGRGAFAGPLLVCAVRANSKMHISGLADSKLLTPNKRQILAKVIIEKYEVGYGWVDPKTIDNKGLAFALLVACKKAVSQINATNSEEIIIDGNINYLKDYNSKTIVKADQIIPVVSAASVVAKHTRDNYMIILSDKYKHYHFDKNKGYGTKQHIAAIQQYGLSNQHRQLFVKKWV